jgi:hypothetical protein
MKQTNKKVTLDELAKEIFSEGVNVKGQVRVEERSEKRKRVGKKPVKVLSRQKESDS